LNGQDAGGCREIDGRVVASPPGPLSLRQAYCARLPLLARMTLRPGMAPPTTHAETRSCWQRVRARPRLDRLGLLIQPALSTPSLLSDGCCSLARVTLNKACNSYTCGGKLCTENLKLLPLRTSLHGHPYTKASLHQSKANVKRRMAGPSQQDKAAPATGPRPETLSKGATAVLLPMFRPAAADRGDFLCPSFLIGAHPCE